VYGTDAVRRALTDGPVLTILAVQVRGFCARAAEVAPTADTSGDQRHRDHIATAGSMCIT
jgi:hypothetical protein